MSAPKVIHEPRCNTNCEPGQHYLSDGIGWPHIHRTDLASECGECVIPPAQPTPPPQSPAAGASAAGGSDE